MRKDLTFLLGFLANFRESLRHVSLAFLVLLFCSGCSSMWTYGGRDENVPGTVYYTVRADDTVASISQRFKISPRALALLNGIHNGDSLRTGQQLLVAFGRAPQRAKAPFGTATARAGTMPTGQMQFSDANAELLWPVKGGTMSSPFGARNGSFHDGIDIRAPEGTEIVAAHSGVVAYSSNGLSGYGNLIVLLGRNGMMSVYAHNRKMFVSVGDEVKRGEKIATVGATGRATGPHLHFEVRVHDKVGRHLAVDPLPFFKDAPRKGLRYRINESLSPLIANLNPFK